MRKLLFIFALIVLLPGRASAAWTLVQSAAWTTNSVSGGDTKVTYGSNIGSGHLLVCPYSLVVSNGTATVTDTLGNTWHDVSGIADAPRIVWTVSASGGADTVEVIGGTFITASCGEYSGQATSGPIVDQISTVKSGTTSVAPSILLPSGAPGTGDLLLEVLFATSSSGVFGTFTGGFTAERNVTIAGTDQLVWADNTSSSGGTVTAGATASAGASCTGIVISFMPAGATAQTNLGYVRPTRNGIKTSGGAGGSISFSGGNTANDTIVVFATQYTAPVQNTVTSVTDTAGNIYNLIAGANVTNGTLGTWTAVYAVNRCGGIATQNVITIQVAGLSDALEAFAIEFAGGYTFDTSQVIKTTTGTTVSGTVTTAGSGELLTTAFNVGSQNTPSDFTSSTSTIFALGYAVQEEQVTGFLTPSLSGANTIAGSTSTGGYNFGIGSLTVALIPSAPSAGGGHAVVF